MAQTKQSMRKKPAKAAAKKPKAGKVGKATQTQRKNKEMNPQARLEKQPWQASQQGSNQKTGQNWQQDNKPNPGQRPEGQRGLNPQARHGDNQDWQEREGERSPMGMPEPGQREQEEPEK